jgi:peptidoglycan/xylan/chitin deacetylase (PgdA/CDA1 family)
MEMNPRLSASVELATRAGLDLPLLLYMWATGEPLTSAPDYRLGVRMRWLSGDLVWLKQTLLSQGRPDVARSDRAIAEFLGDCFVRSGYDYLSLSDPRPAWRASRDFCTASVRALVNGTATQSPVPRRGQTPLTDAEELRNEWRVPAGRGAWFYAATNCLHRLQVLAGRRRSGSGKFRQNGIRILCYHRVAGARDELAVAPHNFRAQMETLLALGMKPIGLREARRLLEHGADDSFVCVTFDDGYHDNLEHAFPVLRELSIPATLFIPTAVIDGAVRMYWYEQQPRLVSWAELRDISADDLISIGGHSRRHPALPTVPNDVAWEEIAGCKRELEDRLATAVTSFAYPAGMFTERDARMVQEAGYLVGVTCEPGINVMGTRPELLHRSIVDRRDSIAMFQGKLTGLLDSPWGLP